MGRHHFAAAPGGPHRMSRSARRAIWDKKSPKAKPSKKVLRWRKRDLATKLAEAAAAAAPRPPPRLFTEPDTEVFPAAIFRAARRVTHHLLSRWRSHDEIPARPRSGAACAGAGAPPPVPPVETGLLLLAFVVVEYLDPTSLMALRCVSRCLKEDVEARVDLLTDAMGGLICLPDRRLWIFSSYPRRTRQLFGGPSPGTAMASRLLLGMSALPNPSGRSVGLPYQLLPWAVMGSQAFGRGALCGGGMEAAGDLRSLGHERPTVLEAFMEGTIGSVEEAMALFDDDGTQEQLVEEPPSSTPPRAIPDLDHLLPTCDSFTPRPPPQVLSAVLAARRANHLIRELLLPATHPTVRVEFLPAPWASLPTDAATTRTITLAFLKAICADFRKRGLHGKCDFSQWSNASGRQRVLKTLSRVFAVHSSNDSNDGVTTGAMLVNPIGSCWAKAAAAASTWRLGVKPAEHVGSVLTRGGEAAVASGWCIREATGFAEVAAGVADGELDGVRASRWGSVAAQRAAVGLLGMTVSASLHTWGSSHALFAFPSGMMWRKSASVTVTAFENVIMVATATSKRQLADPLARLPFSFPILHLR